MEQNTNVVNLAAAKSNQDKIDKVTNASDNPDMTPDMAAQMIDTEFQAIPDMVQLPSKGLFYPDRQAHVKVKLLTAEDENILTSPELIRSGKVLDVLLNNAIIDTNLNAESMLVGDRNAVLLYLRREGYGDEYTVKMSCPECSEEFKDVVLISELEYKEISTSPDADGYFEYTLSKTGWKIKFRLLTGADESILAQKADRLKKAKKGGGSYSEFLTERYVLQVMSVNGSTDKTQIKRAVSAMPIKDSFDLRKEISRVEPGVNMEHDFKCKHCGHQFEDVVPINATLFWPNAKL